MKEKIKKSIALGIVFLFLSAGILTATPISENTKNHAKIKKEFGDERSINTDEYLSLKNNKQEETIKYELVINNQDPFSKKKESINVIEIPKDEALNLENKIRSIKQQIKNEKNPKKIEQFTKETIDTYLNYGILPDYFTYENITDFVDELSSSFTNSMINNQYKKDSKVSENSKTFQNVDSQGGLTLNFAAPVSCLSYFNIWGAVNPFGISHINLKILNVALRIINTTQIEIILNNSGIYFKPISLPENGFGIGKWLVNTIGPIELGGQIWNNIIRNKTIKYTSFWGVGMYNFIEILVGNAISYGMFTGLQLDGRNGAIKLNQPFIGNFIWLGSPYTLPFSLTLYKTWPEPWTVAFEIGIVPCVGISGLMSLLYLQPQ